jgi:hypothetical protein
MVKQVLMFCICVQGGEYCCRSSCHAGGNAKSGILRPGHSLTPVQDHTANEGFELKKSSVRGTELHNENAVRSSFAWKWSLRRAHGAAAAQCRPLSV